MTYANIMENVQEGDLIFCTELSRLGDDIQSKVLAFGLSAEIERKLISERTKQGLQRAKELSVTWKTLNTHLQFFAFRYIGGTRHGS